MKNIYKLLLTLFGLMVASSATAQSIFETENFDALNNGDYVAVELSTYWDTWDNMPGSTQDGVVSNFRSNSSPNSMRIVDGNDALLYFKSDKCKQKLQMHRKW